MLFVYRGRNKPKFCGICGKFEITHWAKHWKRQHPDENPFELKEDSEPVDPWCDNWRDILDARKEGTEAPPPINPKYMKGF